MRATLLAIPVALAGCSAPTTATTATSAPLATTLPNVPARTDIVAARELDQQGVRSYVEGHFVDAVHFFEAAYRAGGPPSELWNIARSREKLDEPEEAAAAIDLYLKEPRVAPGDRSEAERELRALQSRSSVLLVTTTPEGATVSVDGRPTGATPSSVEVHAGTHSLSLHRDGYAAEERTVEARFGRAILVALDLRPVGK